MSKDCCTADHMKATPPWVCPCECHKLKSKKEYQRWSVCFPNELHDKLLKLATENQVTIHEAVIRIIEKYVDNEDTYCPAPGIPAKEKL